MGLSAAALNSALDHIGTEIAYASLHTDDPGTGGTNEVTGGTPAYARKAVTWAAASGGVMAANGTLPTWDVPACTVKYVGLWSLASGGTFYGSVAVTNETFAAQGTYTSTAGSITLT